MRSRDCRIQQGTGESTRSWESREQLDLRKWEMSEGSCGTDARWLGEMLSRGGMGYCREIMSCDRSRTIFLSIRLERHFSLTTTAFSRENNGGASGEKVCGSGVTSVRHISNTITNVKFSGSQLMWKIQIPRTSPRCTRILHHRTVGTIKLSWDRRTFSILRPKG